MADIVFNDKEKLSLLNSIVHPEVRQYIDNWILLQNSPYVIIENAILFESNQSKSYDKIITVTADEEIRITRVMDRNNISRKQVLERMNNQLSNDYKIEHSDFVIINNENDIETSFLNLIPQIYEIHKKIAKDDLQYVANEMFSAIDYTINYDDYVINNLSYQKLLKASDLYKKYTT